jgi:hypothetical protein
MTEQILTDLIDAAIKIFLKNNFAVILYNTSFSDW